MENLMHRLVPLLQRELTYCAREFVKWTLIGILYLVSLWFLTAGLPLVVALIKG
jgi:hypothetical protein